MRRILAAAAVAACVPTLQTSLAAEPSVCVSADIGIAGVKAGDCFGAGETEPLLDRKVLSESGEPMVHAMSNDKETKSVSTCRDYISLNSDGSWTPPGDRFERICNAVMMLTGAQPPTETFLRPGDADLKDTARITALILPAMGDLDPMASPDMSTIDDYIKTGEVTQVQSGGSAATLALRYKQMVVNYREIARGDIDNDGIEDLLIERATTDSNHEMSFNPMLLTRIDKDGLLVLNASFGD